MSGRGLVMRAFVGSALAACCWALMASVAVGVDTVAYVNGDLVLRKLDGTGTKHVATHTTVSGIHFSPGGEKIALDEGRYDGAWTDTIQVYNVPSGTMRTVYHGGSAVSPRFQTWSPCGRYFIWTRIGSSYGYKYDCSAKSFTRWIEGDKFRWSPEGSVIALTRGRVLYTVPHDSDTPHLLADLTGFLPDTDFEIEWTTDAKYLRVGYQTPDTVWHVYRVDPTTGAVLGYVVPPMDWLHPQSRDMRWTLHADRQPALLIDGPTELTVGPDVPSIVDGDVTSSGNGVALTNWWGGAGQWDVWAWRWGSTPTRLGTGWAARIRPEPLIKLGDPAGPGWMHAGGTSTYEGAFDYANQWYPITGTVRFVVQKRVHGAWQTYYYRPAAVSGEVGDETYQANITLGAGHWRLRGSRLRDFSAPSVASHWKYVTVTD